MITLQCFVGFCHTTNGIGHNYIYIYIYIYISSPPWVSLLLTHPIPLGHHRVPGWAPVSYSSSPLTILHMVGIYINATFTNSPTLSFPCCVFKSILYICVSIPSLKIGSSVPAVNISIKGVKETTTLTNNISDTCNRELRLVLKKHR